MVNKLKKYLLLGSCLIMLTGLAGCKSSEDADINTVPTLISPVQQQLKTAKASRGYIYRSTEVKGVITPIKTVDMYFRVKGGYLTKINVKPGDDVKKGDVLAQLDNSDLSYSIKQEEIKLKLAQAGYDDAVKNNASEYEIQKDSLLLESEKLQLEQLKASSNGSTLTADISGKVIFVADVKLSQYINGYQTLVTIADPTQMQVTSENKDNNFPVGKFVTVSVGSNTVQGEVVSNTGLQGTSNKADGKEQDRIVVKFRETPKMALKLGDNVSISCVAEEKQDALLIPQAAVKVGAGDHPYVQIMKDGDIIEKYITTGISNSNFAEVTTGLTEGEEVILN